MTIYTQVGIHAASSGFGAFEAGEEHYGPQNSFAVLGDLKQAVGQALDRFLPIEDAIIDPEFIALCVQDIRGLIQNSPGHIHAEIRDGELGYFGIAEREVAESFFE